MEDEDFGVPAGWYPDPLGLPQLRWWDGQSWTEFTSEAQAPVIMQPSPEPVVAVAAAESSAAPAEPVVVLDATTYAESSVGIAAAAQSLLAERAAQTAAAAQPVTPVTHVEPVAPAQPVVPAQPVPAQPQPAAFEPAPSVVAGTAASAATPVAEQPVTARNYGEQLTFMTRRERREYERRLEAEAALFPQSAAQGAPAAYIQQPVMPEAAQSAAASPAAAAFPTMPTAYAPGPAAPQAFEPEPFQPEPFPSAPLQPEPFRPDGFLGQPLAADGGAAQPVPFADILRPPSVVPQTAPVQGGALAVPVDPNPVYGSGLRELEPALAEILAEAALAPLPAVAPANALPSGFSVEDVELEAESAPERTAMTKRSYTFASWVLAAFSVIQVVFAYLVVVVMNQPTNRPVMAVIWFGGLLVAAGFAGYDRLQLKASGHERPAAGWWALLTPLVYLLIRWSRTRKETGKGALLVLVWLLGTIIAVGLIVLDPLLFTAAIQ